MSATQRTRPAPLETPARILTGSTLVRGWSCNARTLADWVGNAPHNVGGDSLGGDEPAQAREDGDQLGYRVSQRLESVELRRYWAGKPGRRDRYRPYYVRVRSSRAGVDSPASRPGRQPPSVRWTALIFDLRRLRFDDPITLRDARHNRNHLHAGRRFNLSRERTMLTNEGRPSRFRASVER